VSIHLDNGVEVVLRPIGPGDKGLLLDGLHHLSRESARRRFLAPKKEFTMRELDYLTEVDFTDHVAVVAVPAEGPEELLGVGRWVRRANDPELAEVAYVVADDVQGQGLGRVLAGTLARTARERGVKRFVATMLPGNAAARRVMAGITDAMRTRVANGVQEVEGEIAVPIS
jgi:RimJ/RimL family protein N-acetyltransferase